MSNTDHATANDVRSQATRRDFLQRATGVATGLAALGSGAATAEPDARDKLLPTIQLGPHRVTRLLIGGNPIYGYSHFNRLLSDTMRVWHTPERVLELLRHCEKQGINTWQNSYAERTLADVA